MSEAPLTGSVPTGGGALPYTLVLPDGEGGPGIVLCHEIFGVTAHIIERAERLAALGYVVMVPSFFWRLGGEQVIDERTPDGMERAMALGQSLDKDQAAADGVAALEHLRYLPQVRGGVGVFGYCMGGMVAYLTAALGAPDAAVFYYPSGVQDRLDRAAEIRCPTLYEFGGRDQYFPPDIADRVGQATAGQEVADIHVQPTGNHAFDNELLPQLHDETAARDAWEEVQTFLRRWLPAGRA